MNPDQLTYETRRRRDGRWECRCPQLPTARAIHTNRAEAIARCVHAAFTRAREIDCDRRFGTTD